MDNNDKFALISYMKPWDTPLPSTAIALTQGDLQHLIWGYPGIEWSEATVSILVHLFFQNEAKI